MVHLAFAWDTLSELAETYARLRDKRIYPRIVVNHGATLSFYYRDPDMNQVELLTDLLPQAEALAAMSSPTFQNNPVGLIMDPEQFLSDARAGRLTPQMLTEAFTTTEVDVPTQIVQAYSRLQMDAEEFDAKFEAHLGRS
jgi:hypothetical protein